MHPWQRAESLFGFGVYLNMMLDISPIYLTMREYGIPT
jgi:hypothetical protein